MTNRRDIAQRLSANSNQWFQGRSCHPERQGIDKMIRCVRQVLLPNYFEPTPEEVLHSSIEDLQQTMVEQMHRALFQVCIDKGSTVESRKQVDDLASGVIEKLPWLQEMLYEDVIETYNGDPAATGYDEIILTYPGLYALSVYRLANLIWKLGIPLLPRMMTEHAHQLTGIEIHPGATIGKSIMIDHGTGIVIGETAIVGDHVKIYQGVTVGALYFPRDEAGSFARQIKRHPTLEDYCVLYAHATVLGGDTVIGHHSVIGSNAWITQSVPAFSKVTYQSESVIRTKII